MLPRPINRGCKFRGQCRIYWWRFYVEAGDNLAELYCKEDMERNLVAGRLRKRRKGRHLTFTLTVRKEDAA